MALYARIPFLPAKYHARPPSLSITLSTLVSSFYAARPPSSFLRLASRFHRCTLSLPMHLHCARLVIFQFPSPALPPFVLLLRHGEAFECNHQPASVLVLLFLPFFISFFLFCSRGLIRLNGMTRRRAMRNGEKEREFWSFARFSCDFYYSHCLRALEANEKRQRGKSREITKTAALAGIVYCGR